LIKDKWVIKSVIVSRYSARQGLHYDTYL